MYDYEAVAPGELSVKEDENLLVYDQEEDWLLVSAEKEEGKVGFIPGNYVEEVWLSPTPLHYSQYPYRHLQKRLRNRNPSQRPSRLSCLRRCVIPNTASPN